MGGTRDFTQQQGHFPALRNIDNDAPAAMRQEVLGVAYDLIPHCGGAFTESQIYYGIEQMLGQQAAANPMGGWRQRLGRDLAGAEWHRIYDVICWLSGQLRRAAMHEVFRQSANQVLAAHGVVWELGQDDHMHRVLPVAAQAQVVAAFAELGAAQYAAALTLFNAARDAYDGQPRRDRDACSNIFNTLESVAKSKYAMPTQTFGDVVAHIRQTRALNVQIIGVLEAINTLRNRNFGHGMTAPFSLNRGEVDFTYLACIGGILVFTRTS